MELKVTNIQRGCVHDGPGIRTTVFLKGCPLRCYWCHNPETNEMKEQIFFSSKKCISCLNCVEVCPSNAHFATPENFHGFNVNKCIGCLRCAKNEVCPTGALESVSEIITIDKIMQEVLKDKFYYGDDGGLTVSGGEPTFQHEGLFALLKLTKEKGISTCLETCGAFPAELISSLFELVDIFLFDVKDTDEERHLKNTGYSLKKILERLYELDFLGAVTVMRCIIVPNENMNEEHAKKLCEIFKRLRNCQYVELLSYNPYGKVKEEKMGLVNDKKAVHNKPKKEEMKAIAQVFIENDIPVKLYGSMIY